MSNYPIAQTFWTEVQSQQKNTYVDEYGSYVQIMAIKGM